LDGTRLCGGRFRERHRHRRRRRRRRRHGAHTMDIATALSEFGSRKQLRRFAAELGLQADDAESLHALLELYSADSGGVYAVMVRVVTGASQLGEYLQKLSLEGLPSSTDAAGVAASHAGESTQPSVADMSRPLPPDACTECHQRTPHQFALIGCRLCQTCERGNPGKYGMVDVHVASTIYGLTDQQLNQLRDTGGKRHGTPRLFLRSDVEACGAGDEAVERRRNAAAEWKANSFRQDARNRGKTYKWKEWNKATFHMQSAACKQQLLPDGASACVEASGLVYVGLAVDSDSWAE